MKQRWTPEFKNIKGVERGRRVTRARTPKRISLRLDALTLSAFEPTDPVTKMNYQDVTKKHHAI